MPCLRKIKKSALFLTRWHVLVPSSFPNLQRRSQNSSKFAFHVIRFQIKSERESKTIIRKSALQNQTAVFHRPSAPKIPDGEKVDFDVSRPEVVTVEDSGDAECFCLAECCFLNRWPAGHPEETSEQGSDRAAGPDRCSLWVQEEGGGGADRPQG